MKEELIKILKDGGHSLVVAGNEVRTFDGRGVADLYCLLTMHPDQLSGASVADKIVGKGAAALMALGKVKEVYADVISMPALHLLENADVPTRYGVLVTNIINRAGTGLCPIETRCLSCHTSEECFVQIKGFLKERKNNNN